MALLSSIEELDLTAPDEYKDLQIWLYNNFSLIKQRFIAGETILNVYDAEPARASETNLHGGLTQIIAGGLLNSAASIVANNGLSKLLLMPTAGTDFVGDITITGTKVDRVTGVQTPAFVETISIDWASAAVDTSITDANGNTVWRLADGVMSANWFLGNITIATAVPTDVNFSSIDVYSVGFAQRNDAEFNSINTFDITFLVTNVAARFDGYLYSVVVNPLTGRASIVDIANLNLGIPPNANVYYRLRKAQLDVDLNGATDGIFAQLHYSTSPARIEDMNCKIWANNPTG